MTAPAQPTPVTGSDLVGLVMNELEEYGADLDMFGQPTCDEIAAKIPLIAAAPELLAALAEIVRVEDESGTLDEAYYDEINKAMDVARAILAKIRGGA